MLNIDILTIFPELFQSPFEHGIIRRAQKHGLVNITVHNLRDFTYDKHHVVDDRPFGGGEGMVLKPEPFFRAIEYLTHNQLPNTYSVSLLTPQGKTFNQEMAKKLSKLSRIVLICGRYEGVDERVNQALVTDEISIGDYVISGGEFAALIVVDSIVRLIPTALGCADSTENESFSSGLLDCPVYTRPAIYRGMEVPMVLQNGNHKEIANWRRRKALEKTFTFRPDLLETAKLTKEDIKILQEIKKQKSSNPKQENKMMYTIRKATLEDKPAIMKLIEDSARGLSKEDYTNEQIETAIKYVYGVDSDLIVDQTYFVAESGSTVIGCGGWSKRKTLFGGDQYSNRESGELDPKTDPAKIRAFFIHPNWARKGIGKALLEKCESEAKAYGFRSLELLATLPGLKLYVVLGFQAESKITYEFGGVAIDFVPMKKNIN